MTQQEYEEVRAEIFADIGGVLDDPECPKDRTNYVVGEWTGVLEDLGKEVLSFELRLMRNPPIPRLAQNWPYPFAFQSRFLRAFSNEPQQESE